MSMDRWVGEVAIVTGASSGIGAAIAAKLVEAGMKVAGIARRSERVESLARRVAGKKGQLIPVRADITKENEVLKAFKFITEKLGPVHVLINNAGVTSQQTTLVDGKTDEWKKIIDTNVLGLCVATREAVKIMKANKIDGHIIHINSIVGHSVPLAPGLNVYPASKYAVTALTETLRQELNQFGTKIKITSISPGAVATEIFGFSTFGDDEKSKARYGKIPFLEPEDIADSVLYALGTPPRVQVHELTIKPVGERI